jgi:hypothetical protein
VKTDKILNVAAAVVGLGAVALLAYVGYTLPSLRMEYNFLFVGDHQYLTFLCLPLVLAAGALLVTSRRESVVFRISAMLFVILAAFVIINIARLFAQMAAIAHTP